MTINHKVIIREEKSDWVVFIHGLGGSKSVWFRQFKEYKKHFNLLILELRGHGESKHLEISETEDVIEECIGDIIEVMDTYEIDKAHFVGISLGTIVVRNIDYLNPERVKSKILAGAIIGFDFKTQTLIKFGNLMKRMVPHMWLYKFFARILMPKKRHSISRMLFEREAKKMKREEFIKWYSHVPLVQKNHNEIVQKENTQKEKTNPELYIMGDEDYLFLPIIKDFLKDQKNKELIVLKDSGHVCNVDQWRTFNKISIEYITANQ